MIPTKLDYELELAAQFREHGVPEPVPQLRFAKPRQWRFDFAWPDLNLAAEVQGGLYIQGRHNTPAGYMAEAEKLDTAAVLGWRVLILPVPWVMDRHWKQRDYRALAFVLRAMDREVPDAIVNRIEADRAEHASRAKARRAAKVRQ